MKRDFRGERNDKHGRVTRHGPGTRDINTVGSIRRAEKKARLRENRIIRCFVPLAVAGRFHCNRYTDDYLVLAFHEIRKSSELRRAIWNPVFSNEFALDNRSSVYSLQLLFLSFTSLITTTTRDVTANHSVSLINVLIAVDTDELRALVLTDLTNYYRTNGAET